MSLLFQELILAQFVRYERSDPKSSAEIGLQPFPPMIHGSDRLR
jgi:hypothetical protein